MKPKRDKPTVLTKKRTKKVSPILLPKKRALVTHWMTQLTVLLRNQAQQEAHMGQIAAAVVQLQELRVRQIEQMERIVKLMELMANRIKVALPIPGEG